VDWGAEQVSVGDFELESSELQPLEASASVEEFGEAESSELEELDLEPSVVESIGGESLSTGTSAAGNYTGPEETLNTEPTHRSSAPKLPEAGAPPRRRRPEQFSSPTLRAVASTLRSSLGVVKDESLVPAPQPSQERWDAESRDRVVLEFDDPRGEGSPVTKDSLGEDSVWLEFGDPGMAEVTTQREVPPEGGRPTPDVLADGGAVRVDLSLGSRETPNLEKQRADVMTPKSDGALLENAPGAPLITTNLRSYAGGGEDGSASALEDEQTDKATLLEDQITEGAWRDKFGTPSNDSD